MSELKPCPNKCSSSGEIFNGYEMEVCPVCHGNTVIKADPIETEVGQNTCTDTIPTWQPTDAQIDSACLSYDHSFGLMGEQSRDQLRFEAKEWLHAWRKEFE